MDTGTKRPAGTLHIFNPEHDIALASNLANFTAPHAARQLRHDLGWLPVLWADPDDGIVVDDAAYAQEAYEWFVKCQLSRLSASEPVRRRLSAAAPRFVEWRRLNREHPARIVPWGWDRALCRRLVLQGADASLLPTDEMLEHVRCLSHRQLSMRLLPRLQQEGTVGRSFICTTEAEVQELLTQYGHLLLKAPWSSSGRGLRYLSADRNPFSQHAGWFRNTVEAQGGVMVEPYYNKVKDFGMEFEAQADGSVAYVGLSLFHTVNGAYTGNLLLTEQAKEQQLAHYLPLPLLSDVRSRLCTELARELQGRYVGPLGVDMMVVAIDHLPFTIDHLTNAPTSFLHPCVEVNLRRTMGHVALTLTPSDDDVQLAMRITLSDHYTLKINKL